MDHRHATLLCLWHVDESAYTSHRPVHTADKTCPRTKQKTINNFLARQRLDWKQANAFFAQIINVLNQPSG